MSSKPQALTSVGPMRNFSTNAKKIATELFDSHKFGENYGKLVASELELSKHWEQMVNVMLQSANLPNKKEIDEVYKELHVLRKRVSKLESQTKESKIRSK